MVQSIDDARRRSRPAGARIPPHDLQAEESLLGAMLLSRDAIASAVEACTADDFYKPAHGHIFDAICSLYGQGEPVDPVTVADELRRAGLLDAVGGPAVLIGLQTATPATSSAGRYGHIVADHSMLRRLIAAAGEIADMGYDVPEDVTSAIDRAESMVFDIGQRRVADTLMPIRELLALGLDRLEALYERGDAITGVPTGYHDLDEQLSGLQRANLVIVGARPAMGKAQPVLTPVLTPRGWVPIGSLRPGDRVIGSDGRPTRVLAVFPQGPLPVHRVAFSDGAVTTACGEHLWEVNDRPGIDDGKPGRILTTQEVADELAGPSRGDLYVPVVSPVELPEADLPQDPYRFGRVVGAAHHVRIPAAFMRASADQRLALLQGLMDVAGTHRRGLLRLVTPDCQLAHQVVELVRGLGGIASIRRRGGAGRASQVVRVVLPAGMCPFRSPDKMRSWADAGDRGLTPRRRFVSIEGAGVEECVCILVDADDHLYVTEGHVVTHNTSFALGMAAHAAMEARRPVLFFSLEMSHLEITQRLLCAEARVDATRMRNGRLAEQDWSKISHAIGRLGEAPIFVDDNPNLTVMDIRAKARRLKSREDLGLVVIDYLQLMTGRNSAENRQVEVSEISRGLKILARELDLPVVALSQLSRNLETRSDKRPMLADLRESGCMTADTRVLRADTGVETTFGELITTGATDIPVWSLDRDLKIVPSLMTHVFATGIKEIFELRLASGLRVKASGNHPFLTVDGWRRLDELSPGDRIATPRVTPEPLRPVPLPEAEVVMLAHLLGDGCVASGRPIQAWLEPMGLAGLRSWEKFIPPAVFSLPNSQLSLFLRHLWATDGSVRVDRVAGQVRLYYASTSRRLIDDLQRLLLRFGITGRVKEVRKGAYRPCFHLCVYGRTNQLAFFEHIGVHGARGELVPDARRFLEEKATNTNLDTVPREAWGRVKEAMRSTGVTSRALAIGLGSAYCGSTLYRHAPSRERMAAVATLVRDPVLDSLAGSDVFWDRVVDIEPLGQEPVYDATVADTHNFIADGITAHNSLEQDADVVMFIYRDEVYSAESPDRGTAEVIVAKHRNGPTGVARLAFLEHYARFANMARGA